MVYDFTAIFKRPKRKYQQVTNESGSLVHKRATLKKTHWHLNEQITVYYKTRFRSCL